MKTQKVNVANQSDNGHFVENADNVICLDENNEMFFVEGPSILTTKNHTTLKHEKSVFVWPQDVYNPYRQIMERAKD